MTTLPAAALTRQTTKESYKILAKPVSKSVLSHFLFEKIYFSKINSWNWKLYFTFLYFYEFIEKHLKWSTQWIFENEHLLISKFWKKKLSTFLFFGVSSFFADANFRVDNSRDQFEEVKPNWLRFFFRDRTLHRKTGKIRFWNRSRDKRIRSSK